LLADLPGVTVTGAYLRAEVHHPAHLERACLDRLGRLFGLHAMSPARRAPRDLDGLAAAAIALARELPAGETFKVETRRRDKRYPLTSIDVSREVGGRIAEATGLVPDMHGPAHTLRLEIDAEGAWVHARTLPGPGGLPV